MKKAIAWILALCLLAMGLPAMAATSSTPLFTLADNVMDSILNFAYDAQQGRIYALGNEQLYTMNEDGSNVQTWAIEPYDLGEDAANGYFNQYGVYFLDGTAYVLGGATIYENGRSEARIRDYGLHTLTFDEEAGTVRLELAMEVDGEGLIEYDGDYAYVNVPSQMIMMDGKLYGMSNMMNGTQMVSVDPESGSVDTVEMEDYTERLLPYRDGKLLAVFYEYGDSGASYHVSALDPENGDMEELFVFTPDDGAYPNFFGYDPQSDCFYYDGNGELFRVEGMNPETAVAVAAYPVSYANYMCVASDGNLLVSDYESIWKINTDPDARPEQSLTVQHNYNMAMEEASVAFQQAHPEVEVVLAQSAGDIVQAMMTQTTSPDIYTLYVNSSEYSAVFERGFMAELTGSEILSGIAESVYPAIQEVIMKDGEVYGLPVEMYGSVYQSYSPAAFERIGLTEEDVPTTWMEFFDLLARLPEYLENDPDVSVFDPYMTQENLRYSLFSSLLDNYMLYISQPGNEFSFDTPLFRELMAAFEAIDYEALGIPEEYDDSSVNNYVYDETRILFLDYGSFGAYVPNGNQESLYLALDEGIDPMVPVNLQVAFVNPYSENRELAIEYLESASERLDDMLRIHMMPGENEPLPNSYYEEGLKSYDDQIASLQQQLENAEEVDRQALETQLEEIQGYREDYEKNNQYDASAESIAKYRDSAQYIVVATNIGMDEETSSEYYEQRNQYLDGAITLDEFIRNIDQKLQMIVLEGR